MEMVRQFLPAMSSVVLFQQNTGIAQGRIVGAEILWPGRVISYGTAANSHFDKDAAMDQYHRFPCSNLDIHCCAVFSGGMTTLLLTPGTGICRPTDSKPAARYRQTAAAIDEAAQTNPTVPPFDPAVRDVAIALLRFRCCEHRSTVCRSYL